MNGLWKGRTARRSFTFANLPASGDYAGEIVRVTDVGVNGSSWEWTGTLWHPVNGRYRHHKLATELTGSNTNSPQILDSSVFPAGLLASGDEIEVFLHVYKSSTSDTLAIKLLFGMTLNTDENTVFSVNMAATSAHMATKHRFRVTANTLKPVSLNNASAYGSGSTGSQTDKQYTPGYDHYLILTSQRTVGSTEIPYVYDFAIEVFKS